MKAIFTIMFLTVTTFGFSQTEDRSLVMRDNSKQTIDSLLNRIEVIERRQQRIKEIVTLSGHRIRTGASLLGVGLLASIAGSVMVAVAKPEAADGIYKLSPLQVSGLVIGSVGLGMSIGGAFVISSGGGVLRDL